MLTSIHGREVLTLDDLREYPTLCTVAPHESRSERYSVVPTIEIVDELMCKGWYPVQVGQSRTRQEDRKGFQKHMVRLTNPNLHMGDEMMDLLLYNSHDGSSSYQVRAGVYRFVCSNGMVVGQDLCGINVKHVGFDPSQIIDASFRVVDSAKAVAASIGDLKSISISKQEAAAYERAASELLFTPEAKPIPGDLTYAARREDRTGSLWSTFNAVQENWAKGRTRYRTAEGNLRKHRTPASVDKNIKLNQALWTLTEEMAKLKKATR